MTKTIGVVGGGQLCLMLAEAVRTDSLPFKIVSLDPSEKSPASGIVDTHIVGDFANEAKIRELAGQSDVVTFEIELAGSKALAALEKDGKPVFPSSKTLAVLQDKLTQIELLQTHGVPVPDSRAVESEQDIQDAIESFGLPLMIKARLGSYDGKGNAIIRSPEEAAAVLDQFSGTPIMAQKFILFEKEVSVMCARSVDGKIVSFPVAENEHGKEYNILHRTLVPAQVSEEISTSAIELAERTVQALDTVGIFGIEMLVADGNVLINEIAPRVHNSGHYSIEGCTISQFAHQLRAVAGMELEQPKLTVPYVIMYNIIGVETGSYEILYNGKPVVATTETESGVFVHHYGKTESKPHRKMGHITILSADGEDCATFEKRASDVFSRVEIKVKQ